MENDFIKSVKKKLTDYNTHAPEDRVYLQLDKPFYAPGDDIWFSAYVRDGLSLKPSNKSDIVHIELISPKGTIEKRINIIAKNGKAAGDFSIDKEALGGLYKIRAYTTWMKNEGKDNVFEKDLQVQDVILPNLKMKLDFEKKAFGAGDEVIAKLELNTNENVPLRDYKIKFVANLNGQKLLEKAEVTDENGMRYIKFNLPKELKTNDGLLNIMIDYNGSTESISRSIPIILNKVEFTMFPEGGDLVCGLDNNVAFTALNEFGKPADVEGVVLTEKGSKVASFSSFHQGMGAFKFNPQTGETYHVKITKPEGITEIFKLPSVLERGYVLNIDNSKLGEVAVNINTTETEKLAIVAQVRGKLYYSTLIDAKPGSNKFIFSTDEFPIGVSQITLFDSKGIARAERLAFVNKHKQLNISVDTEKEKYLPREKVKMTLTVKDERGLPMPANLSMAVVNDQLLSFADDKSGNILSQLLLQQDINKKIEEPAFYFNNKEPKADKALDYVMMTAGWRRFSWEKLMEEELPVINYLGERAIIAGTIYNGENSKPMPGVKIKIPGGVEYESDSEGKFSIKKVDLTSPVSLMFNSEGYYQQSQYMQDYNQNLVLYMYKKNYNYYGYTGNSKNRLRSKSAKPSGVGSAVDFEDAIPMAAGGMVNEKAPMLDNVLANNNNVRKEAQPIEALKKKDGDAFKQLEGKKVLRDQSKLEEQKANNGPKDIVAADAKVASQSNVADRRFDKNAGDDLDEWVVNVRITNWLFKLTIVPVSFTHQLTKNKKM
ncbi:MAG: hypothetical protein IPJ32_08070 [Sphingobacteriaceae bacterium]|nr:hypothetical protein [Sphingobacteriaceae bacterium]